MDKYKIDSHKLIYHIPRVHDWLKDKLVYPIYMEISPAGGCNHRCTYCGLDFMEYKPRFLKTDLIKKRICEFVAAGVKSLMYAGEGEPLLHHDIADIIKHTKDQRIDVSITTNGLLFEGELADQILSTAEWVKIGVDAATEDTYAKIHRCDTGDFDKVISNITSAVKQKKAKGYQCALGIQLLLLPDNHDEVIDLAHKVKEIGVDYFVVKPYSQHTQSKTKTYGSIKYDDYEYLAEKLEELDSEDFNIIFRAHTIKKWNTIERNYGQCLALPFWSYIDAGGNVWGCSVFLGDERFLYGNIYDNSFKEIWEGEKRLNSLSWVSEKLDIKDCRINCRMDEINRYLWDLKNPPAHVNFI